MNEHRRLNASINIAEPLQDFSPTVHVVRIRAQQPNPKFPILFGNRCAVAVLAEHVCASHKRRKSDNSSALVFRPSTPFPFNSHHRVSRRRDVAG
jgi:hypothetical protein